MRNWINVVAEATKRFALTPKIIATLEKVRHEERCSNGGGGACHLVSDWIEAEWDFERVEGNYHESEGGRIITVAHFWNVLPDGSILDATADQFGEGHDIRLIAPNDPEHSRYQPRDYDQDDDHEEKQYQEARARGRENPSWWLKDRKALDAYDAKQQELYGRDPKWRIAESIGGFTLDGYKARRSPFGARDVIEEPGYLYHGTAKVRLPGIRREGLKPSTKSRFSRDPFIGDYSLGKVFFTTSADKAKFYALEASKSQPALLRIPASAAPDAAEDTKDSDSVFVEKPVPATVIEYWSGKAWKPVSHGE